MFGRGGKVVVRDGCSSCCRDTAADANDLFSPKHAIDTLNSLEQYKSRKLKYISENP